jgi:hypothetical protein
MIKSFSARLDLPSNVAQPGRFLSLQAAHLNLDGNGILIAAGVAKPFVGGFLRRPARTPCRYTAMRLARKQVPVYLIFIWNMNKPRKAVARFLRDSITITEE